VKIAEGLLSDATNSLQSKLIPRMKIYLESTIPSYFTARPSADAVKASRQAATIRWHEDFFAQCDCYISRYVIQENSSGDPECVQRRLDYLREVPDFADNNFGDRVGGLSVPEDTNPR